MKFVYIHCDGLTIGKNVYDLIKLFGYMPERSRDGVIRMYKEDYLDMINTVPFMKEVMNDEYTVTKITIED